MKGENMNDEQKTRSGLARYEQEVKTTRDYFKNFRGFGTEGTYLGFERKNVMETARGILELNRGQVFFVSYNRVNDETYPRSKYSQNNVFEPIERIGKISLNGSLDSMFKGVNTDNMLLKFANKTIEIQKIVIGEQFVSEIRELDKLNKQQR